VSRERARYLLVAPVVAGIGILAWRDYPSRASAQVSSTSFDAAGLVQLGCADCRVLAQATRTLRDLNRTFTRVKVSDGARMRLLTFDERAAPISEAEFSRLEAEDNRHRIGRLGNFTEAVAAWVDSQTGTEELPSRVFVLPDIAYPDKASADQQTLNASTLAAAAAKLSIISEVRAALVQAGANAITVEGEMIFTRANRKALGRIKQMAGIFSVGVDGREPLRPANHLTQILNHLAQGAGTFGAGQTVGFLEPFAPATNWRAHLTGLPPGGIVVSPIARLGRCTRST